MPGTAPVYLQVTRYTSAATVYYSAYSSPNGTTWTLVPGSTQVLAMTGTLLAGFGITSHAQGTGSAVTLDSGGRHPGGDPTAGPVSHRVELHRHRGGPAGRARTA